MSRKQCHGEFTGKECLLVQKPPVDRPLVKKLPRELEGPGYVAKRVDREEGEGDGELNLGHEECCAHCPLEGEGLQYNHPNSGCCEQKAHLRAYSERVCHASDGPYPMLVRINGDEEETHGKAIVEKA